MTPDAAIFTGLVAVIILAGKGIGQVIAGLVDSLKSTSIVRPGYAGAVAMVIAIIVGFGVGCAAAIVPRPHQWVWLLLGTLAGFYAGLEAISANHAAVGAAVKTSNLLGTVVNTLQTLTPDLSPAPPGEQPAAVAVATETKVSKSTTNSSCGSSVANSETAHTATAPPPATSGSAPTPEPAPV